MILHGNDILWHVCMDIQIQLIKIQIFACSVFNEASTFLYHCMPQISNKILPVWMTLELKILFNYNYGRTITHNNISSSQSALDYKVHCLFWNNIVSITSPIADVFGQSKEPKVIVSWGKLTLSRTKSKTASLFFHIDIDKYN